MTLSQSAKTVSTVMLAVFATAVMTGCRSSRTTAYGSTAPHEPSGGGAAVAAERPGAGVGAQTSVGAAADVPEATQKGAGASNLTEGTAAGAGGGVITDLSTLSSTPDPAAFAGRTVQLSNARVQAMLGDNLIALKGNNNETYYVLLSQPAQNLREGDLVSLNGTIQRVPADVSSLGLSGEASHVLQSQPVYIQARQVQVINR